ncbi:MAG: DNA gyrase subunit A [Lachnospiraceae bacterium]|nr:DNA gyrase subunit A [Lachnospiraceae bacterium]
MDEHIFDKIKEVDLKKTMESSYIDYAMSVIVARALPDVRDGLKPVQRRILHSMSELNNDYDKPHRKCARIVGDTMGKYHPHGDSSIYEALVKLAQDFSTRYPLVDGHGNFGSVDGDSAAAMRYTEARLSRISASMLADIEKDTVDFIDNFDGTEREPVVLPSRYPNLLVNGTSGIAVGMATNIPPHNLGEVIDASVKLIDNKILEDRETSVDEVMQIIKGPDFPTGAKILGRMGIEEAYRTGRGKIKVRAVTEIETMPNGKNRIVVTELPYMVNKAKLIEKIAELHKEKKVDGITELRDESNRQGMRVCIELRKDVNPEKVLNKLFKHTQLQDTFGVIMLALVDNEPKILNICEMLRYYILHQEDVVTRRTKYDLGKAKDRAHILEGLLIALDNIDEIIAIIKASANVSEAKTNLINRFGFTDIQAQSIVDMRLRALTNLEREKIEEEYNELLAKIAEYEAILADKNKLLALVKEELLEIRNRFADERRTTFEADEGEFTNEDFIPDDSTVIAYTHIGYIKRMTLDNFRAQKRGGKGIKGMETIEDDFVEDLFMTTNHHNLLFFTSLGRVYRLKAYDILEAGRTSRGKSIANYLELMPDEKVNVMIPVRDFDDDKYLFMATKSGIVKKVALSEFKNIRKMGMRALDFKSDEDELIEVKLTDGKQDIVLVTKNGQCLKFNESEVRSMGRTASGVRGMSLTDDDQVIAMQLESQGSDLLVISENGIGKRTSIDEYEAHHRGGKGIRCFKQTEKSGVLVGAKAVDDEREIMLITTEGILIRIKVSDIRRTGRNATGVKLMNLGDNIKIATVSKVRSGDEETDDETEESLIEEVIDERD